MRFFLIVILLLCAGCTNVTFRPLSIQEQMQFHKNYDGANGNFYPDEYYIYLYKNEK